MRISWNWLSELVDLSGEVPSAIGELLTQRGIEVESIDRLDKGFEHVVTGQILERNPHPQADRLSVCKLSLGSGDPLEIVCGAQNMKAGDKVAVAQVGAHLPNDLKIAQSKIRGVTSNGMLCSEAELKLKESSEGILILPASTPLGKPLADILGLNDTIFTLKVTPNRGDCLSHFGIARELGSALGRKPKRPKGAERFEEFSKGKSPISTHLEAGDLAPQFFGCYVEGVRIGPSPEWLVKRLEAVGSRSINNVVDATNLVMLELGQPLHAYDVQKLKGNELSVRMSREGESLVLLDGQTITLQGNELVIADQEKPVSLAGVMGGGNSEIQNDTHTLFLECAEFNPSLVRKASSKHQRKTDAAHRFERGVDPAGLTFALARVTSLVLELAGGKVVGTAVAQDSTRTLYSPQSLAQSLSQSLTHQSQPLAQKTIHFGLNYISDFLGFENVPEIFAEHSNMSKILKSLDCQVEKKEKEWVVTPPSYRLDLRAKEDIAEEVARSIGYDKIPSTLPMLSSSPVFSGSSIPRWVVMDRTKDSLVRNGLQETINYAFTSRAWLSKLGLSSSVILKNPLSEEYEAMVPSLIPGLIKNTLDNWNHHFGSEPLAVRLFELRPVFSIKGVTPPIDICAKDEMTTNVEEKWKLSLVVSGPRYAEALRSEKGEVDFYDLKAIIDCLLTELGARGVRYQPMAASRTGDGHPLFRLFHPGQSVEVLAGNSVAGYFGLLHPGKARELKARSPIWLAELDWDSITKLSRGAFDTSTFKKWPEYPSIERDFSLVVKSDVTADKLCQLAMKSGKPLIKSSKVFDIYHGSQVAKGMTSVAVRVIFYDEGRSIQEAEAEAASVRILESWKKELGAELRS